MADGKPQSMTLEEVYETYRPRVFGICWKILRNTEDAEDLTQEVFIQLQRTLSSYRGESSFTTWLHRVTVNQVFMHLRRTKKGTALQQSIDDDEVATAIANIPARVTFSEMERIDLVKAVNSLAPGYKKILLLHDFEGHDHEECARIVGYSSGTSKSQLHGARLNMRKALTKKANPKMYAAAV